MGIIKVLDESVSNMIAAGEVVENPASMIKELLENSLDAESKNIKIDVKNGGKHVIISDDGKGMSQEDLLMSVERHATSKIRKKEDLYNLFTYGFRGEALSSIAAVSKMILSSKDEESSVGSTVNVSGGKITGLKEVQRNRGTTIEIKDLFFNTPARLKFLRKATTEYMNIKDIVIQEALGNADVAITLILDDKVSIKTTGNGLDNAVVEIFGNNVLKNCKKFSMGYLGNGSLYRSTKDSIFTFVNGRMVKSKLIENAVIDGYYTKLMKGKYPFAIIFLEIDPQEVDVNVHPSKKIVKFSDEKFIYEKILREIENTFERDDKFVSPTFEEKQEDNSFLDFAEFSKFVPLKAENKQFEDIEVDAVKIGMLSTPECMKAVAKKLLQYKPQNVVIDPVMYAKNGCPLMNPTAVSTLIDTVIPLADVLTPNIPEAGKIADMQISTVSDMEAAARKIYAMGCKAIVVKGGHHIGNAVDVLFDGENFYHFETSRIDTKNTHGTGCTFSSAIASQLAKGKSVPLAVESAKAYVTMAIEHSLAIGKGCGPTHHFYELYQHGLSKE